MYILYHYYTPGLPYVKEVKLFKHWQVGRCQVECIILELTIEECSSRLHSVRACLAAKVGFISVPWHTKGQECKLA